MSPDLFLKLSVLGLSHEQMTGVVDVLKCLEAEHEAKVEKSREKARARLQKWRDKPENVAKRFKASPDVSQRLTGEPVHGEDNLQTRKQEENKEEPSQARSRRGSPIPDDFVPDIDAAVADGLSRPAAELMAKNFVDYWRARPGKEGLKLDWPATWRVWYRRDLSPSSRATAPPRQGRRNFADVAMDRMNGHGPKGVFSTDGDAERISAGKREPRPDDGNLRGGIAGRYLASDH